MSTYLSTEPWKRSGAFSCCSHKTILRIQTIHVVSCSSAVGEGDHYDASDRGDRCSPDAFSVHLGGLAWVLYPTQPSCIVLPPPSSTSTFWLSRSTTKKIPNPIISQNTICLNCLTPPRWLPAYTQYLGCWKKFRSKLLGLVYRVYKRRKYHIMFC